MLDFTRILWHYVIIIIMIPIMIIIVTTADTPDTLTLGLFGRAAAKHIFKQVKAEKVCRRWKSRDYFMTSDLQLLF